MALNRHDAVGLKALDTVDVLICYCQESACIAFAREGRWNERKNGNKKKATGSSNPSLSLGSSQPNIFWWVERAMCEPSRKQLWTSITNTVCLHRPPLSVALSLENLGRELLKKKKKNSGEAVSYAALSLSSSCHLSCNHFLSSLCPRNSINILMQSRWG